MLPGVFQDGGEIPAHLMLGRECDYGVETAAAVPAGQIGGIELGECKHRLADGKLEGADLAGTGRFHGEDRYTTKESERLLRLPMYYNLSESDQQKVIDAVHGFYHK